MAKIDAPYYPIIYVRGYAMTQSEIEATVSTPYMGFNLGATKVRQDWQGNVKKHIFESPLIRLMKDYGYVDTYSDGAVAKGSLSAKRVFIYRYYDQGDEDFGDGKAPSVKTAASGLNDFILDVKTQVCGDDAAAQSAFKVYLVAHSMGGLVCRCFLQNPQIGQADTKALVDKVFTYATPHNGIDMAGMNTPSFLSMFDMNNFNRKRMADYLNVPAGDWVNTLNGTFDPRRFFCLVGTNHKDYNVAYTLSRRLAGEMSDGLVRIPSAVIQNAPRAFVYRSHSGPYGIVNSEEGYQNLVRFLFGTMKITGILEADALPLPPPIKKLHKDGKDVRASYLFEATVAPRGAFTFKLTERRKETYSAVHRKFDELFTSSNFESRESARSPILFSTFLDERLIHNGKTLVFSVDLGISTTGYEFDGFLGFDHHIPGEYLFRNTVTVRATKSGDSWSIRYILSDESWAESRGRKAKEDADGFYIPLKTTKGFKGKLRLKAEPWS
ncbi:hypothetical protein BVX99_01695 [bacterium F16]|nr:hypothetical protein BVX99_01695 [bacterium F16]